MTKKIMATLAVLGAVASAQWAAAQTVALPDLGFKLGDDVATVKAALRTTAETEPMARNAALPPNFPDPNKGKAILHLRTRGIWAFFGANGNVETIRLDAPFAGNVLGIKLGDDARKITSKLGNPVKKPFPAFLVMQGYQYAIDDSAYATFDVNDDGVQFILITR
ncbi:hypothetical protein [Paraburkholderia dilworthii]|uniref:hypothetical protein n=1 Tax=Paraburkholderia dilworthii TaxID=948106 RepID=UPI0004874B06|nr:hypothetical protein [Paraburkholderia dilworthii]